MGDEPPETRGPARLPLADVQRGIILTIPMAVVFGPIGVTFGVIAVDAGLSPLNAVLMSLLVYAGAAQLAAIQLLALGAPMLSVVATAAAVNSRYLVLSASIAPHFLRLPAARAILLRGGTHRRHLRDSHRTICLRTAAPRRNLYHQHSGALGLGRRHRNRRDRRSGNFRPRAIWNRFCDIGHVHRSRGTAHPEPT